MDLRLIIMVVSRDNSYAYNDTLCIPCLIDLRTTCAAGHLSIYNYYIQAIPRMHQLVSYSTHVHALKVISSDMVYGLHQRGHCQLRLSGNSFHDDRKMRCYAQAYQETANSFILSPRYDRQA